MAQHQRAAAQKGQFLSDEQAFALRRHEEILRRTQIGLRVERKAHPFSPLSGFVAEGAFSLRVAALRRRKLALNASARRAAFSCSFGLSVM